MKVVVGEHGGFCFGVRTAVEAVERRLETAERLYTVGPIIHNPAVVSELESRGAIAARDADEVPDGAIAVIRSHGVPKAVTERLLSRNVEVVDATCPFVKRIHERVERFFELGYPIIIVGKRDHPEVEGINGWCENSALIANSEAEASAIEDLPKALIVAQTTISPEHFERILSLLVEKVREPEVFNSICSTTVNRQGEALRIAKEANAVIVVGGKHSSNTNELFNICKSRCGAVYRVENSDEIMHIPLEFFDSNDIIGIVAGASTPDWMIREVSKKMNELNRPDVSVEEQSDAQANLGDIQPQEETPVAAADTAMPDGEESAAVAGAVEEPEAAEAAKDVDAIPSEEADGSAATASVIEDSAAQSSETDDQSAKDSESDTFLAGIEKTLVRIRPGQLVTGTVVQVSEEEVCVNIGYKSDGFIMRNEFSSNPDDNPAEILKPGDEIEVEVIKVNDGDVNVLLSRKRVTEKKFWEQLIVDKDNNVEFEGIGKEVVKGGVIASINGVRAFVPASHLSLKYVENLEEYVGQPLRLQIIEVDKYKKRVVASQKLILQTELEGNRKQLWESLEEGQVIHGIVRRITDFGAFVDIGGIDGLLHVTDLSWHRVKHPADIVSIGEELDVQVLSVDPEKERVSLGLKQLRTDPWLLASDTYPVGSIIEGKVVRIVNFGAFVAVEPGIDGLIHISQVATKRVNKVEDELTVGDIVRVKVLDVDTSAKRISLSRKQVLMEEQAQSDAQIGDFVGGFDESDIVIPPIQQTAVTIGDFFPSLVLSEDDEVDATPTGAPIDAESSDVDAEPIV